jgi:hypothetical protein
MREASVHTGRTRDVTPAASGRLGNEHHRRDRRARLDGKVRRGYHPRRGGRYDSQEDWSPSPEPPGLQALCRAIRRASFPIQFRALTTITKYSGETRPELWLADYRLACQLGGTDDHNLIIRNLPLFLSDAARAWLEHLPPAQISNWDDLVKAFTGNFQGTYVRPGNSWDLRSCRQQPGESLREYIRRFSKQRTELPNITDSDVIGAFLAGTTCRDLVSKLGRKIGNARLTKVLMDGGSSLNIIYAETLGLLKIDLSTIRAGAAAFHGIVPGKRVLPLGQLDLPICFGTPSNFRRETLTFEVVGF